MQLRYVRFVYCFFATGGAGGGGGGEGRGITKAVCTVETLGFRPSCTRVIILGFLPSIITDKGCGSLRFIFYLHWFNKFYHNNTTYVKHYFFNIR